MISDILFRENYTFELLRITMNYKLLFFWFPVILWMALIYTLSSFEAAVVTQFDLLDFIIKKTAHMVEYGILWYLTHRAISQTTKLSFSQI